MLSIPVKRLLISVLLTVLFCGCAGYRFAGDYNSLPREIQTISIPFFKNESFEANIEAYVTNSLINEFVRNKQFDIVPKGGDATLTGVVRDFRTSPIAYTREDRAREYRAYVELEVTVTKNDTGEVVWRNPRLVYDQEYYVSTDIAFTDADKKTAIQEIANELAKQIYEAVILGF